MRRKSVILAWASYTAVFVVTMGATQLAPAQQSASRPTPSTMVQSCNADADATVKQAETLWREKFRQLYDRDSLKAFIGRLSSLGQKLDNTVTWAAGPQRLHQQMRDYFREEVGDERKLITGMKTFLVDSVELLREEDQTLAHAIGHPLGSQEVLCNVRIATTPWDNAFEPVFRKAARLSQDATAQSILLFAGSNLLADGINDVARSTGINQSQEGSTVAFLADLFLNVVVGEALDQTLSPTERFLREIEAELRNVERTLLDGPQGLLTQLRNATQQHQQALLNLIK